MMKPMDKNQLNALLGKRFKSDHLTNIYAIDHDTVFTVAGIDEEVSYAGSTCVLIAIPRVTIHTTLEYVTKWADGWNADGFNGSNDYRWIVCLPDDAVIIESEVPDYD